ncbi:FeoB-associated Cys-rich membrane protein [Sphingobacterium griseoflavum]|uniref:FeoB-associated Cys-rich membrane protein n=1 Tax=Sphingobacterium griseoflavum TaxID=1474952 RepID=UPI001676ED64
MDLTIQYIIVALVFIAAIGYLLRRFMPSRKKSTGCGKGCGCALSNQQVEKSQGKG